MCVIPLILVDYVENTVQNAVDAASDLYFMLQ